MFTWDDSYTIALKLKNRFPEVNPENVSLDMVLQWTLELPEFNDDPGLANEEILGSILIEWYEEYKAI